MRLNPDLSHLMQEASRHMGRTEALVLVDLEDDPSSPQAVVSLGDGELVWIPRDRIVAVGRSR